jgi:SanA protein
MYPRASAFICVLFFVTLGAAGGWTLWTLTARYRGIIYTDPAAVPARPVALVFGAGYWPDGTPSDIMRDRVAAAVELYRAGKVRKILLSGDNRFVHYNEPAKMREVALALGMPEEDIVLDYAGRRTYDTCYRAKAIFGLTEVVVVTQRYHLPRALYTCQRLGLDAVGYAADRRPYIHLRRYQAREVSALWLAWWDLWIRRPQPVLGDPIPIFP